MGNRTNCYFTQEPATKNLGKVMAMGGWKDMMTMMIYMRKAGIDTRGATKCLDDILFS